MRNYSIGHELILLSRNNPMVILNPIEFDGLTNEMKVAAIQEAAIVCRHSWKENQGKIKQLKLWKLIVRLFRMNHTQALGDWLKYRVDGSTFPPVPDGTAIAALGQNEEGGRQLGSPFFARIYAFVVDHVPREEIKLWGDTAFDFPLGLATFLYMAHTEQQGGCKVENSDELEQRLDIESKMADVPKENRI